MNPLSLPPTGKLVLKMKNTTWRWWTLICYPNLVKSNFKINISTGIFKLKTMSIVSLIDLSLTEKDHMWIADNNRHFEGSCCFHFQGPRSSYIVLLSFNFLEPYDGGRMLFHNATIYYGIYIMWHLVPHPITMQTLKHSYLTCVIIIITVCMWYFLCNLSCSY